MTLPSARAIFLDRDGVLNASLIRDGKPYPPRTVGEFTILPGVPEALAALKAAGFRLIVVTNQPDIARGTTTLAAVEAFNTLLRQGCPQLDAILTCPHDDPDQCPCRKPKPGLLLQAAKAYNLSLRDSFMIGDRWRDIAAGQAAGCATVWINLNYREKSPDPPADFQCTSLPEAAAWILKSIA